MEDEIDAWLRRPILSADQQLEFRRMLRKRRVTLGFLASMCKCNRSHLSLVISGKRRGKHTFKWLKEFLSYEEMQVLRGTTCCNGNNQPKTR